jgi:hypothetical protein
MLYKYTFLLFSNKIHIELKKYYFIQLKNNKYEILNNFQLHKLVLFII